MAILTAKSYFTTRPETPSERAKCVEFTADLPATGLHPVITATLAAFDPLIDAYDAARIANEAADTRLSKDSERVHGASAAFGTAIGRWLRKIDDVNDKDGFGADALKPKFGDKVPSDFLGSPDWTKVATMPVVFAHVDATPSLVGSAAAYQAVKDSTDALRAVLADQATSTTARTTASKALVAASNAFDRTWGNLVRDLKRYDPDRGATVPRFRRVRGAGAAQAQAPAPADPVPPESEPSAPTTDEPKAT